MVELFGHKLTRKHLIATLAIIFAFIVLPTGTPEDIPTTFLIIWLGGWRLYMVLAAFSIILLMYFLWGDEEI